MADDFNPYQAPDSPVVEDFITFEPRRRPTSNFVAAATCFGAAAFLLSLEIFVGCLTIAYPRTDAAPRFTLLLLVLVPIAYATLAFLLAGRAFWRMRDRLGVILFLTAVGAFASIFLVPVLFP